jgi:DNA replication protein DnaC
MIIDDVGYIPSEAEAANLFLSSRYERTSVIVTSNKPFRRWGEVFGAAAGSPLVESQRDGPLPYHHRRE